MECYLDNSATTAVSPEAAALALHIMTEEYGNPSSLHRRGFLAERAMTEARGQVAAVLHCRPEEIIFTAGGTESNNIALLGAARAMKRRGNRIVTTAVEHHSVLAICKALENEGFEVITVAPDESGHITPEAMAAACNEKTILASCMMVNSETGAIHDLPAIAAACRRKSPNLIFHADCVQSFCRLPIDPVKWGIQLVSVSGHKIHGPKGVGLLYVGDKVKIQPIVFGGGQQQNLRSGTENVPGIAGLAKAAEMLYSRFDEDHARLCACKRRFIEGVERLDHVKVNGLLPDAPYGEGTAAHIVSVSFAGVRSEVLLHALEDKGIYVSAGSACSAHKPQPSATLKAIGVDKSLLDSTIRFSFSVFTTEEEIDVCLQALYNIVPMLRRYSRR